MIEIHWLWLVEIVGWAVAVGHYRCWTEAHKDTFCFGTAAFLSVTWPGVIGTMLGYK